MTNIKKKGCLVAVIAYEMTNETLTGEIKVCNYAKMLQKLTFFPFVLWLDLKS